MCKSITNLHSTRTGNWQNVWKSTVHVHSIVRAHLKTYGSNMVTASIPQRATETHRQTNGQSKFRNHTCPGNQLFTQYQSTKGWKALLTISGDLQWTLGLGLSLMADAQALSRAPTSCWSLLNTSRISALNLPWTSSRLSTNCAATCNTNLAV